MKKSFLTFPLIYVFVLGFALSIFNYSAIAQDYEGSKAPQYRLKNLGITVSRDSSKMVEAMILDDGWTTFSSVSGMTYNPIDSTFWIMLFDEDSVQHLDLYGQLLEGGFSVEKAMGLEAITLDSEDNSFWMVDILGDKIVHYDKHGTKLDDGFNIKLAGSTMPLGITYQPPADSSSVGSLWVLDYLIGELRHYSKKGEDLNDGFEVLSLGCVNGRGLFYNPNKNSMFILNNGPQEVIHVDLTGKELSGSFQIKTYSKVNLLDAMAYDPISNTFWITQYDNPCEMFHIRTIQK